MAVARGVAGPTSLTRWSELQQRGPERGLAGLRPLTPDGGSPRPRAASKAGATRNRIRYLSTLQSPVTDSPHLTI